MAENQNPDEPIISRQISVYKTTKKLLAFNDKLKPARPYEYANIYAAHKYNGHNLVSCIGLLILNYSEKVRKKAECNLSPESVIKLYEYSRMCMFGKGKYITFLNETKIISSVKDAQGRSPVTKVQISRQEKDNEGNLKTNPWFISIEQGTGIAVKTKTGGFNCQSNSYTRTDAQFILMTDEAFFNHMSKVYRFLIAWEQVQLGILYPAMKKIYFKRTEEKSPEQDDYEKYLDGQFDAADE